MKIKIGNFDCTECWDGVFYKKLSAFPKITDWEIQTVLDFIAYEKLYGRECKIEASDEILSKIEQFKLQSKTRLSAPAKITECTACPTYKGCMTDFVCHTSPVENAAKDPADYFEYIMFAWGNCQAGDRLVMERKLKRFPNGKDLSEDFTPGVRFFFDYKKLCTHPNAVFEGVLPLKIKDEVILKDWIHAIVVPENERTALENHIPQNLAQKVHFVKNNCKDIWAWSEKVYEFVKRI